MNRTTTANPRRKAPIQLALACLVGALATIGAQPALAQVSLTTLGTPYTQNFDTLASSATGSTVPTGWVFVESGTNANGTYTAGTGSSATGDTYSFGAAGSTERAFGGLQSGSLIPTLGASFTNNTGATIASLDIAYTGEQWRLGATGRTDQLSFQYSTTATSLTTGAWTDVHVLDFTAPVTAGTVGALDGNLGANRTVITTQTISGLSIPPGATIWIRWNDFNATGSDDGLAIDDFSLTPQGGVSLPTLSISSVSLAEGNSGTTTFSFVVSLSAPAGPAGVSFDIATSDGSATTADNDYVAKSLNAQTISSGQSNYQFDVTVNGDTVVEPDQSFTVAVSDVLGATPSSAAGTGTILNDDVTIAPVSLTSAGTPYTQTFDTLASTGTSFLLPTGWFFAEAGANANALYSAGTGSSNAGDTYSFGAAGSPERAFGGVQSGSLIPTIGAWFVNDTGITLTRLGIAYTGEQWRLGATGRADRLDFQYSLDASSLTTGTWTDVDTLDFSSPVTGGTAGALDGNADTNRAAVRDTIVGLSIPPGATFWIRWNDFNASGADDGLSVDDFSIVPNPAAPSGTALATPNDLFPGDSVLLTVTATPGASPIASVSGNLSAIGGGAAQPFYDDGSNGDQAPGNNVFTFATAVALGTGIGPKTLPVTITDTQGRTGAANILLTVSPVPTCAPTHSISQIQGNGPRSPIEGLAATTSGVVYDVRSNGFYIQMPVGDGDPTTSDGVFVFTGGAPPAAASRGNAVCVSGTVSEFVPSADPNQAPLTEISGAVAVARLASGQPLPAPTPLTAALTTGPDAVAHLEALEGMRVSVESLTVVGPSLGTITESNATASNSGVFYGVVTGVARPFREAGIDANDPVPPCAAGMDCAIPVFDTNPERLRVVSNFLGTSSLDLNAGTVITGLVGPLDYAFRTYTIGPESTTALGVTGGAAIVPVPTARGAEITVASQNLQRFFDDVDDPDKDDAVLTTAAYQRRLAKASRVIREVLGSPDIVSLVEIENQSVVDALAARINQDALDAGAINPQYVGYLQEGNDIGGIDVAFLVKSSRIAVTAVTQYGKDTTFLNPVTGNNDILNDRPPLVLDAVATRPNGDPFPLTVIANHLRSLTDVDTPRVQAKRKAQGEFLADLVQTLQMVNPDAHLLLVGDFNAFDVNDGYVDVLGTIEGIPSPPEQVVAASADLVDPNLSNLNLLLPPAQRYSYVFDGSAQTLDHALANAQLMPWISRFAYGRSNADFAQSLYGTTSPARLSDHDGSVTFIDLGAPTVSGRIRDAQASPSGDVWVDIEVTNAGDGFAGQVTITEVRFSALKASGPVVLTTPVVVGALAPGETRVVRVTAVLPAGSKFNVQAKGQFKNQQGITRGFVVKPEMFK
jgi:predicted extracellular nuclease